MYGEPSTFKPIVREGCRPNVSHAYGVYLDEGTGYTVLFSCEHYVITRIEFSRVLDMTETPPAPDSPEYEQPTMFDFRMDEGYVLDPRPVAPERTH